LKIELREEEVNLRGAKIGSAWRGFCVPLNFRKMVRDRNWVRIKITSRFDFT
jgi:hypothetical protein